MISPRPIAACLGLLLLLGLAQAGATPTPTQAAAPPPKPESTADHSKFKELQGPFASGPEVTQACLGCHTEAAKQVHKSIHWTWELNNPDTGQRLGKKHLVNSYCVSITSNYARCTSCHVGYGWKDGELRLQLRTERGLSGLPRHHRDLQEVPHRGRAPGLSGHRVRRQAGQGRGPGAGRPACRPHQPRHLRGLPLQRRRRGRGQARRHGHLARQARRGPGRPHERRGAQLQLRHLPHLHQPPVHRQPLCGDGQGRDRDRHARRQGDQGHLRVLPRHCAAPGGHQQPAQHPCGQGRLRDLPYPRHGARRQGHQDLVGLVHRRAEGRGRQAPGQEGRQGQRHL